jgi:hypothetical protein
MAPEGYFYVGLHSNQPTVPVLSQIYPIHTFQMYFSKIDLNIILQSTPRSSKWSVSFRFCNQNSARISHLRHARYTSVHLNLLDMQWLAEPHVLASRVVVTHVI